MFRGSSTGAQFSDYAPNYTECTEAHMRQHWITCQESESGADGSQTQNFQVWDRHHCTKPAHTLSLAEFSSAKYNKDTNWVSDFSLTMTKITMVFDENKLTFIIMMTAATRIGWQIWRWQKLNTYLWQFGIPKKTNSVLTAVFQADLD